MFYLYNLTPTTNANTHTQNTKFGANKQTNKVSKKGKKGN